MKTLAAGLCAIFLTSAQAQAATTDPEKYYCARGDMMLMADNTQEKHLMLHFIDRAKSTTPISIYKYLYKKNAEQQAKAETAMRHIRQSRYCQTETRKTM